MLFADICKFFCNKISLFELNPYFFDLNTVVEGKICRTFIPQLLIFNLTKGKYGRKIGKA
jgi:hypothetical protein